MLQVYQYDLHHGVTEIKKITKFSSPGGEAGRWVKRYFSFKSLQIKIVGKLNSDVLN